jgi:hypothetical protein
MVIVVVVGAEEGRPPWLGEKSYVATDSEPKQKLGTRKLSGTTNKRPRA